MIERITTWARFVQFSHTVFSLPFALIIFFLSGISQNFDNYLKLLLAILTLTFLRSSAMSFNRILDIDIESENPRTKHRELISGQVTKNEAWIFLLMVTVLYFIFSLLLTLPIWFIILYLAIVWGYSFSKRFTWLCHFWIGLSLAGAPVGMWLVFVGPITLNILIFSTAVFFWVAGFDIIYSLQDIEYDRTHAIKSIPVRFGVKNALFISRLSHFLTSLFLFIFGFLENTPPLYYIGVVIFLFGLIYEQSLVSENDITKVNKAFFTINGYISLSFMAVVGLSTILVI